MDAQRPVKKDICISPGNCSTYCEMGIDLGHRQRARETRRRRGFGMCAHICPRGVLKLENRPVRWKGGAVDPRLRAVGL